ncbi:MAG: ribosomal protein S1 [Candidatus Xenolissoclinum pacificiensis L6]|uniref:Ribosomal protein S1 n=1 Tax=Candidatus Xenolissoclinum pacificiensis L6 TaxID=1401685 RepID=W2V1L8_9RICK|nr:MAG: ribosomal protein S1 [Candidatus Xenolissoclinum pacificiensis L6]
MSLSDYSHGDDITKNASPENRKRKAPAIQLLHKKSRNNDVISAVLNDDDIQPTQVEQQMFSESMGSFYNDREDLVEHTIVRGKITTITKDYVLICIGYKSEGQISVSEFSNIQDLKVGDYTNVYLERIETSDGRILVSKIKAERQDLWDRLEEKYNNNEIVVGQIIHPIKSGCIVNLGGISAFLPSSHVDVKLLKDTSHLHKTDLQFKILKMNKKQNNIVVSRKVVLHAKNANARKKYISELSVGNILFGLVKSITNYGVFMELKKTIAGQTPQEVDNDSIPNEEVFNNDSSEASGKATERVGVIDGLLYIDDISWSRVSHPSSVFSIGQVVKVMIIGIDEESGRISLGTKQLVDNPWDKVLEKYSVGQVIPSIINSIEEYGMFAQIEPGVEGLIHNSEISWNKSKISVIKNQKVDVKILSIDKDKQRMALSIKQCQDNPWEKFANLYPAGTIVSCIIKNITDNSLLVEIKNDIAHNIMGVIKKENLIDNYDDVSAIKKELRRYSIGSEIQAKILRINVSKGRVFLGVKQVSYDPFLEFLKDVSIGDEIQGMISQIFDDGIQVLLPGSDGKDFDLFLSQDNINDLSKFIIAKKIRFKVTGKGDYSVDLKYIEKERKDRDEY